MKCELCHKVDAETAITRGEGDAEEELYVCNACAKAERQRRPGPFVFPEKPRPGQQPQHAEQDHLHEPADGVAEPPETVVVREAVVSQVDAGRIDGHEAVAPARLRHAERGDDGAKAKHMVHAVVGQLKRIEQPGDKRCAEQSDDDAKLIAISQAIGAIING